MKLSLSNISFDIKDEYFILKTLKAHHFDGIEIAPTIFVGDNPYDHIDIALKKTLELKEKYGLIIASIQSIWYGKDGNIFDSDDQRILLEYTKKIIDFASKIDCRNLVFGCPKNRNIDKNQKKEDVLLFFREIGSYAMRKGTILSIEPNPAIYGTNFLNYTEETFDFVRMINCNGIKVNIDLGTMIENKEPLEIIRTNIDLVNHIHISEPYLAKIRKREEHILLAKLLEETNYEKYVSIEMQKTNNISDLIEIISYVKKIFKNCNR